MPDKIKERHLSLNFSDLSTSAQELIAKRIAESASYKLPREAEDEFASYEDYILTVLYDIDEIVCDIDIQEIAEEAGIL